MVKRTVNQDDPTVYHLFYGDDDGSPGMDLTFFEYPCAARASPAPGWCTGSSGAWPRAETIEFWRERLPTHGAVASSATGEPRLRRSGGA